MNRAAALQENLRGGWLSGGEVGRCRSSPGKLATENCEAELSLRFAAIFVTAESHLNWDEAQCANRGVCGSSVKLRLEVAADVGPQARWPGRGADSHFAAGANEGARIFPS